MAKGQHSRLARMPKPALCFKRLIGFEILEPWNPSFFKSYQYFDNQNRPSFPGRMGGAKLSPIRASTASVETLINLEIIKSQAPWLSEVRVSALFPCRRHSFNKIPTSCGFHRNPNQLSRVSKVFYPAPPKTPYLRHLLIPPIKIALSIAFFNRQIPNLLKYQAFPLSRMQASRQNPGLLPFCYGF
jgi:hypothetical protein